MLANKELFEGIETELRNKGVIGSFEEKHGRIVRRMMVTLGEVPENLVDEIGADVNDTVFIGTFDFCGASVGMAVDTATKKGKGGVWITPDASDEEPLERIWCEFFLSTVMRNIAEDGTYGVPMFTFCSDDADFTVIPAAPNK